VASVDPTEARKAIVRRFGRSDRSAPVSLQYAPSVPGAESATIQADQVIGCFGPRRDAGQEAGRPASNDQTISPDEPIVESDDVRAAGVGLE
jgi:hypothetical protein